MLSSIGISFAPLSYETGTDASGETSNYAIATTPKLAFDETKFKAPELFTKQAIQNFKNNMAEIAREEEATQNELLKMTIDRQNKEAAKEIAENKKVQAQKQEDAEKTALAARKLTERQFAGALQKGTVAAFSASLSSPVGIAQEQLTESKKQTKAMNQIVTNTQKTSDNTQVKKVSIQ